MYNDKKTIVGETKMIAEPTFAKKRIVSNERDSNYYDASISLFP